MLVKLKNIENTINEEVAQLKITVKLLSEKASILEINLNNTVNSQEELADEKIAEHQVNRVSFEMKEDVASGSKAKVFNCDQCEFKCKSKNNFQKHVNTKHLTNSVKCSKC